MFDRWFDSHRWWWCALSGLLLIASFPPFSSSTCGWIALVPAWCVITRSERARRQAFRHGYLIGLIYFGGTFWWISNVTALGTFFLILYLALYPAVWFFFLTRLLSRAPSSDNAAILFRAISAAAVWTVLEWWRSWFLTGFNWNELGISQAPSIVFRQLAAFGGVHLISFVLVAVNVLWAEGLLAMAQTLRDRRTVRPSFPFAIALLICALTFALGWMNLRRAEIRFPTAQLHFICIQPNIPQLLYDGGPYLDFQHHENAALDHMRQMSLQAIAARPDLLIWPEATIDEGVFQDRPMFEAVQDICFAFKGDFLFGSQDFDLNDKKLYNSAYLFTPRGETFQEYRKTRLVILGEFLPFGDTFPWMRKALGIGMDFTPGPGPKKFTMTQPDVTFAPLICFEDTLPEVASRAARLHPEFFVTITNDGWYRDWWAAWGVRQHLNHAVFRCVEHDLPMIRCANTGISCVIDRHGTVINRLTDASGHDIDVGGVFDGTLEVMRPTGTFYEAWGEWIVLISQGITAMLGLFFLCRFRVK